VRFFPQQLIVFFSFEVQGWWNSGGTVADPLQQNCSGGERETEQASVFGSLADPKCHRSRYPDAQTIEAVEKPARETRTRKAAQT
jgi:hypothetical protein